MKRLVCVFLVICMAFMLSGCNSDLPEGVSMVEYTDEIQSIISNEELMDELSSKFMSAFGSYDTDGMSVFLTFDENTVVYVVGLSTVDSMSADYDVDSLRTIIEFDMSQSHAALDDLIDWLRIESGFNNLTLRVMYITADSSEIVRYDYPRISSV